MHDTARYLPLFENLSLKEPSASVSNFHILRSGNSLGNSLNFSHLLSSYFFANESSRPTSNLADYLVNLLSILS